MAKGDPRNPAQAQPQVSKLGTAEVTASNPTGKVYFVTPGGVPQQVRADDPRLKEAGQTEVWVSRDGGKFAFQQEQPGEGWHLEVLRTEKGMHIEPAAAGSPARTTTVGADGKQVEATPSQAADAAATGVAPPPPTPGTPGSPTAPAPPGGFDVNPFGGNNAPFKGDPAAPGGVANPDIYTSTIAAHPVHNGGKSPDLGPDQLSPTNDVTTPASALLNSLKDLPADKLKALQGKLHDAGYGVQISSGIVDAATEAAYVKLLTDVSFANGGEPGKHVTPDAYLDKRIRAATDATTNGHTSTSTSVSLSDPGTARTLLEKAAEQHLGRKPTANELADFTKALGAAEKAHPQQTTTTSTHDVDGYAKASSSTTTGGVNPADFTDQYLQNNNGNEAATYNVGTTYYNAALSVLGLGGR